MCLVQGALRATGDRRHFMPFGCCPCLCIHASCIVYSCIMHCVFMHCACGNSETSWMLGCYLYTNKHTATRDKLSIVVLTCATLLRSILHVQTKKSLHIIMGKADTKNLNRMEAKRNRLFTEELQCIYTYTCKVYLPAKVPISQRCSFHLDKKTKTNTIKLHTCT